MIHPPQQLPLKVQLRDDATLDNFLCAPDTRALLSALRGQLDAPGEPIIYLYGPTDTGKTHLLQAACHLAETVPVLYLPLSELIDHSPQDILQGVESMGLVCLDDIQAVMGNEAWELALFDFFNYAREQNCRLLISADAAPRELPVQLADLRSRLSWGIVYQLKSPNDEERQAILCFRADRRGLRLTPEVSSYIIDRAPRTTSGLLEILETLDTASLVEQRSLSIPFVKTALGW